MSSDNIVLIGFMGSGKSRVGMELARALSWQFLDTDALIEASTGMSIDALFREKGEAFFREEEKQLGRWLSHHVTHAVIATGGGFPFYSNIKTMGTVVYLELEFDAIAARMDDAQKAKRPLFDNQERAKALFETRAPYYREMADLIVDATRAPELIVQTIMRKMIKES